jgi:hypothetical protein
MAPVRALLAIALVACSSPGPAPAPPRPLPAAGPDELRAPAAFSAIPDRGERARAMFVEIARVLTHPRCVNCHPADDTPRQGDRHAPHDPPVTRGPDDRGVVGMQCTTCHQERNAELARVPGAKDWHLAPREMAWLGKTPGEICAQLSDPARNGGRTLAEVAHHVGHDALVAWGWEPGHGRARAPGSQVELAALFEAWIADGAACPPITTAGGTP